MAAPGLSGACARASRRTAQLSAAIGGCLLLGACASAPGGLLASAKPDAASAEATVTGSVDTRAELAKATEFWGKAFTQNPRDPQFALNYARNLKAMGEKQQALGVLQQAAALNGTHRGIMGEYGRLALDLNHVTLAQKLLEQADDPANPDWKIVSARGTALAKQGLYREAIPLYERALAHAPNQASVLSNLALAYAMEGHPEKAEPLLKRAADQGDARVNQNLALVLGLQGKYDEAKLVAARDLPADRASASVDFVQQMVRAKAKPLATAEVQQKPAVEVTGAAAERKTDTKTDNKASTTAGAAAKP